MTIDLKPTDIFAIAIALRESAKSAYIDERLVAASCDYDRASRFYSLINNHARAEQCAALSAAIVNEIAARSTEEETE